VQKAGATWQGTHRLVGPDGELGPVLEGSFKGTSRDLTAAVTARIRAHMAAEYPAISGDYLEKIITTIRKTLLDDAGRDRELWQDRYAAGRQCKTHGGNDGMAPYLLSYIHGAEKAAEILYPNARQITAA